MVEINTEKGVVQHSGNNVCIDGQRTVTFSKLFKFFKNPMYSNTLFVWSDSDLCWPVMFYRTFRGHKTRGYTVHWSKRLEIASSFLCIKGVLNQE